MQEKVLKIFLTFAIAFFFFAAGVLNGSISNLFVLGIHIPDRNFYLMSLGLTIAGLGCVLALTRTYWNVGRKEARGYPTNKNELEINRVYTVLLSKRYGQNEILCLLENAERGPQLFVLPFKKPLLMGLQFAYRGEKEGQGLKIDPLSL